MFQCSESWAVNAPFCWSCGEGASLVDDTSHRVTPDPTTGDHPIFRWVAIIQCAVHLHANTGEKIMPKFKPSVSSALLVGAPIRKSIIAAALLAFAATMFAFVTPGQAAREIRWCAK